MQTWKTERGLLMAVKWAEEKGEKKAEEKNFTTYFIRLYCLALFSF